MFRRRSQDTPHLPPAGPVVVDPPSDPPLPLAARTEAAAQVDGPNDAAAPDAEAMLDLRLVRGAQQGELASFNSLVRRHEQAVFNVCLRLLRDAHAAEDATQETFVKGWTAIHTFRGELVRPWLLRIATNRCYDLLRARHRRPARSLDAEPFEIEPDWTSQAGQEEHPESFAVRTELALHLERALAALPDDQRLAAILIDVQGYGYDETAAITGAALGTVKSRISRARARLRQMLRDDPACAELFERFGRLTED